MKFKIKDNVDPRILEDLGFNFYTERGWKYNGDKYTKIIFENDEDIEMPLILYYLIKLDLIEII